MNSMYLLFHGEGQRSRTWAVIFVCISTSVNYFVLTVNLKRKKWAATQLDGRILLLSAPPAGSPCLASLYYAHTVCDYKQY